jgi:hypothetical protein
MEMKIIDVLLRWSLEIGSFLFSLFGTSKAHFNLVEISKSTEN